LNFLEESHISGEFSHALQFGILSLASGLTGGLIGKKVPESIGLISIIGLDICIVSTTIYMLFVSFTGKWYVIFIIATVMSSGCIYVSFYPSF